MKRILTSFLLLALVTIAYAGAEVTTNTALHCALRASPEIASALDL
jgi:hypothetical protein